MAEYYPLLAKAIASLPNSNPETRRAIYERARKALLGQLRAVQPPVPENDIDKENQALDLAIARLESEFAAPAVAAVDASAAAAPPPEAIAVTSAVPKTASAEPLPSAPPAEPKSGSSEPENQPARPRAEGQSAAAAPSIKNKDGDAAKTGIESQPLAPASLPAAPPQGPAESAGKPQIKMRPEQQRPVAPQIPSPRQGSKGLWIVLSVIGLIVAGIAFTAWKLRDKPEDLAKIKFIPAQQQTESSGKIVERAGDPAQSKNATATTAAAAQSPQDNMAANVPVSYRAALLVQAPEEKTKVKTYFGTVIWHLDNVSNGPGEPVGTALHANIDIPEDKLQASMTLQKNLDASLSASHTMTIVFTVQPSSPTGTVKQIGVPQMRKEDSATGESLIGLPVPIMENSFLIGLAKGGPESANIELLKTRQWVDVPMLLADGRIAKLTFEKGVAGLRATEDAVASWQAP